MSDADYKAGIRTGLERAYKAIDRRVRTASSKAQRAEAEACRGVIQLLVHDELKEMASS